MSTTTPPGWYPDPGPAPGAPPHERWWDGHSWTGHTRPAAGTPVAAAGLPGAPVMPGRVRRGPLVAAGVGAAVLAAALAVGGVLVLRGADGATGTDARPTRPAPRGSESAAPPGDVAQDPSLGIGLPVPGAWERGGDGAASVHSEVTYDCPVTERPECVRGGASVQPLDKGWRGQEPRRIAQLLAVRNAERAYPASSYGGIVRHEVTASGDVTIAGGPGYRVRWRIENKSGPDAHVETVVFRSPHDQRQLLTLFSSVDVADDAPPATDLDRLRDGIVVTAPGRESGDHKSV